MGVKDAAQKALDKLTGETLGAEIQKALNDLAELGDERIARYALYDRCYEGELKTNLPKRAKDYLESNGIPFTENYCDKVADSRINRLQVRAFTTESESAAEWIKDWVEDSGVLDEFQSEIHDGVEVKGDAFAIVEYDNDLQKPVAYSLDPAECKVRYDARGEIEHVVRVWPSTEAGPTNPNGLPIRRMNIFYPDRIEKWFTTSEGKESIWSRHLDTGEGDWPQWWTTDLTQGGEPLGVMLLHFRRMPRNRRAYGKSVLRKAIPMQEAFNKKLVDEFEILDQQAWNQRWATGIEVSSTLPTGPGRWLKSGNPDARFGQLDSVDPKRLTDNMEAALRRFATATSTPLHEMVVSGTISGESRRMIGTALTDEVSRTKGYLNRPWRDMVLMALRLESVFGSLTLDDTPIVKVEWADYEDRSDSEILDDLVTEVRELNLSRTTALQKRGYDAEAELEASAEERRESAAHLLESFDGGNGLDDVVENP